MKTVKKKKKKSYTRIRSSRRRVTFKLAKANDVGQQAHGYDSMHWVTLTDGQYFYVARYAVGQNTGKWFSMDRRYEAHPDMNAAIRSELKFMFAPNTDGPKHYRRIKGKVMRIVL